MATKVYRSTSNNFQITHLQETKVADSTGHSGRARIVPGKTIQFIAGAYTTSDAAEQTLLDAKVADPHSGIS